MPMKRSPPYIMTDKPRPNYATEHKNYKLESKSYTRQLKILKYNVTNKSFLKDVNDILDFVNTVKSTFNDSYYTQLLLKLSNELWISTRLSSNKNKIELYKHTMDMIDDNSIIAFQIILRYI